MPAAAPAANQAKNRTMIHMIAKQGLRDMMSGFVWLERDELGD